MARSWLSAPISRLPPQRLPKAHSVLPAKDAHPIGAPSYSPTFTRRFWRKLQRSTSHLICGDPLDIATRVTPMISTRAAQTVAALVERARDAGYAVLQPNLRLNNPAWKRRLSMPRPSFSATSPRRLLFRRRASAPISSCRKARGFRARPGIAQSGVLRLGGGALFRGRNRAGTISRKAQAGILKTECVHGKCWRRPAFHWLETSGYGAGEHGEANVEFFSKRRQSTRRVGFMRAARHHR